MRLVEKLIAKAKLERKYATIKSKTTSALHNVSGPFKRYRRYMIAKGALGQRTSQAPAQIDDDSNDNARPESYIITPSQVDPAPLPHLGPGLEAGGTHPPMSPSHDHRKNFEYTPDHFVENDLPYAPASLKGSVHGFDAANKPTALRASRQMSIQRKPVPGLVATSTGLEDNDLVINTTALHEDITDPQLGQCLSDNASPSDDVSVFTDTNEILLETLTSRNTKEKVQDSPVCRSVLATRRTRDPQIEKFEEDLRDLDADIKKMKIMGDYTRAELIGIKRKSADGKENLHGMFNETE